MVDLLDAQFSLVRGGPFHSLQQKLGLLNADGLPEARTALVLVVATWLAPALLTLAQGSPWTGSYAANFFLDPGSYARLLIAMFVLTIVDRSAHRRLNRLLSGFVESGIVGGSQREAFVESLRAADRRTSSGSAEALILIGAYGLAFLTIDRTLALEADFWVEGTLSGLNPAGWWWLLVSTPLYFFLMLRWFWRLGVWAWLLATISRLPLQLVPTHPDRAGGLGFLTLFPMVFVPFTFALSTVIASSVLQQVVFGHLSFDMLRGITVAWLAVVGLLFIGPLCVFSPTLLKLRESALLENSELVARIHRRGVEQLLAQEQTGQALDPECISTMADIAPTVETVRRIRLLPLELWAVIPLAVAAAAPLIVVASVQVPIAELLQRLVGALL